MTTTFGADRARDGLILLGRILLIILFVVVGWENLTGFKATEVSYAQLGLPLPLLATIISISVEIIACLAIGLGILTRPLAILLAIYTLATAFIGFPFWDMTGAARSDAETIFLKNIGITGGFILLYVTGAGRHSIDAAIGIEP